jgi:hypothetical protein
VRQSYSDVRGFVKLGRAWATNTASGSDEARERARAIKSNRIQRSTPASCTCLSALVYTKCSPLLLFRPKLNTTLTSLKLTSHSVRCWKCHRPLSYIRSRVYHH